MEYKDMTKAELIKIIKEQQHLAEAVEAKDKEIAQHLKDIRELAQQNEKVKALEEEKKYLQSHIKAVEEQDKKLREDFSKRFKMMDIYRNSFQSLMKSVQGSLDNTIELEALLFEKIFKIGDKK